MDRYNVTVRVEGEFAFDITADSLEDAIKRAREHVASMGSPFPKGTTWMDGKPEVIGVCACV